MNNKLFRCSVFTCSLLFITNCGEIAKEVSSQLGIEMSFQGTVKTTDDKPIEDANVKLIALLDFEALTQLVDYRKKPDGKGGTEDLIRIKLDKVHGYAADYETTTDSSGKFSIGVPVQPYLVYVFGPGADPGSAGAYSVAFWGINTETGELDLEHLIGADGGLEQINNDIYLSGGPSPEPAPQPSAPQSQPTNPASTTTLATTPTEPTTADPARPEETVSPTADAAFWSSINIEHSGGSLGTSSSTYTASSLSPASGSRFLVLTGELATAQEDPVYVVMQSGFDSNYSKDCTSAKSAAKTYVYPTNPNGKKVEYKFVPPSKYYKIFLAKTASKSDGAAVTATSPSQTIVVGDRSCANALPDRRFITTLTWGDYADLALHTYKYDKAKLTSDPDNALVDEANWTHQKGITIQHDVDNVVGFGPENITEDASVTAIDDYCYVIKVHYYSGTGNIDAKVDTTMVLKESGVDVVKKYSASHQFTTPSKEWWTVGIYPEGCPTLE